MSELGLGQAINELRQKINNLKFELDQLGGSIQNMPELITSTNLLRSNEHLTKVCDKQSELLSAYEQYSFSLEEITRTIFGIQNDLKNLLKEQSKLIFDEQSKASVSKKKKISKRKSSKR